MMVSVTERLLCSCQVNGTARRAQEPTSLDVVRPAHGYIDSSNEASTTSNVFETSGRGYFYLMRPYSSVASGAVETI